MNKNIAIMGCGWLGFSLAKSLIHQGFTIFGTTTSEDKIPMLQTVGITPYKISISEKGLNGPITTLLEDAETLIINIPPKLRGSNPENYIKKMEHLCGALKKSKVKKVVFVSSTSVYGNDQGVVTDDILPKPTTASGKQLLASEKLFLALPNIETTIIRFGGLIGKDRHPITMLSGKKGLRNGNHPVNLIHLEDCIGIIESILKKQWWGEIFNAAFPLHPTKKDYYQRMANQKGLIYPEYDENSSLSGKIVDSSRLIHVKKYVFKTSILP
ncbi:NAD(P)H-binding protein [Maribacter sp. ANRC-HE7]|uniref:NAD(P)H-binding protein n=1 Tax=Maribacter aquimaris TaxID=2737171 RepID=A0ABR7V378_9FLAO|nr:NAD-dependent epimerase/dehydratase family protein [Maribacter aquimaris]MBD0779250.1 NAD(P)H-binding protein [Maribacter aquimaris]